MILPYNGIFPKIADDAYLLEPVVIVGDVIIESGASVWFHTVIRGDVGPIRIGARTNIQDLCMLHCTKGVSSCIIEEEVTVGHRAVIHGAYLNKRCLIGMGAVILDNAEIGEEAMVGAGALVPQGAKIPPRTLAIGVPAKVVRELTESEIESLAISAQHYEEYARQYYALLCPKR
jgi:carbonic anhydrase/acetyltransferase-like protein (isoleucine patch superfamily)